jgi:O-acetyl-ADP-ribose deacetylase (regulator of RNase III)
MPIHYLSGDLFANEHHAQALAHGCNCQGAMGAGIAVEFRRRYPAMYAEYRRRCKAIPRQFNVGDVFLWKSESQPWVLNLATQEHYRGMRATYAGVEQALTAMRALADAEGIRGIGLPRLGAGHGGLAWGSVRASIERVFAGWPGALWVYETFTPAREGNVAAGGKQPYNR